MILTCPHKVFLDYCSHAPTVAIALCCWAHGWGFDSRPLQAHTNRHRMQLCIGCQLSYTRWLELIWRHRMHCLVCSAAWIYPPSLVKKCIRGFLRNKTVNKIDRSCSTELLQIVYPLNPSDIKWPVTKMHRANHSLNWTPKQAAAKQQMLSLRRLFSFHIFCLLSNKASGQPKALQHSCLLKLVVCSRWLVSKTNSNPLIARNDRKCLQWLGTADNYTR